jgi:hypothetical protein
MMMKPHRATMLIVFAILGWFICGIFSIVALIMSKGDIKEMEQRRMDPSGLGTTKAAFWLSLVAVIMMALGVVLAIAIIALAPKTPPPSPYRQQQPPRFEAPIERN